MKKTLWPMFALLLFVFVACGGFLGCETGYTNGTGVGLTGSFTGLYANPTGGVLVASSTGTFVSYLKLTQSGTDVNAVDNNGIPFEGTLNAVNSTSATVTLQGKTTAGAAVSITASLTASGSSAIMSGTWTEPTLSSPIYGTASITPF
jgi:hypothetical protein